MTLHEWLITIGIIVIFGVLIDGIRRIRLAKKRESELSFGLEHIEGNNEVYGSELPNGGGRIKESRTADKQHNQLNDPFGKRVLRSHEPHTALKNRIEPDISSVMEDSVTPAGTEPEERSFRPDGESVFVDEYPEEQTIEERSESAVVSLPRPVTKKVVARKSSGQTVEKNIPHSEKLGDRPEAHEIIIINLKSKGSLFDGGRLLKSLMAHGMRFGDRSIFHRHARKDGNGSILFSVANGVEPGFFDVNAMESSTTPAISLFMSLPGPKEPLKAFVLMEETARQLALDLGAELKDENYSVLTHQTIEHYRQRICEFERKQMAHA